MKTYIKIFIFLTILIYLICSINSGSWDPINWANEIRKNIFIIIFVDFVVSLFITAGVNVIFD